MTSKNNRFVADLAAGMEHAVTVPVERPSRLGGGVLGSRTNRLADLASGAVVDIPQELVDPARCRIWEHHNRDYSALNEDRCADLIETIVAQGKQEFPAIVRRFTGCPDPASSFFSGALLHCTVSLLPALTFP